MNNPFWASGIDVLGYSLNALRFSNLGFQDADSPPRAMERKMGFRRMRWGGGCRGDAQAGQGAPLPHGCGGSLTLTVLDKGRLLRRPLDVPTRNRLVTHIIMVILARTRPTS
ncbi:hypothetical protein Fmac_032734 [Flemingia macrophylla]|uniref:Uncharacterized protein n=1 Tax=Flemingia macrophylla TaxID=520843 RepID=A0ABD1L668_9FABA